MFSALQIGFVLLLAIGISNHVLIMPQLLKAAGRDAWISVLIGYILLLVWGLLFARILKSVNRDSLCAWLQARIGIWPCRGVVLVLLLLFLLIGYITLYDTVNFIKIFFLPFTPYMFIFSSLLLLTWMAARDGLRTIVYMSAILLPLVWVLGHFVSTATFYAKDYSYMMPILAEGMEPVWRGTLVVFSGITDLFLLLLLQQRLKKPMGYLGLLILITLLSGLVLGPVLGSISAFGPVNTGTMRVPAFAQWRLLYIGKTISHVDFLAVFQFMAGAVVRLALILHLVGDLMGTYHPRSWKWGPAGAAAALFLLMLFPPSDLSMQLFMEHVHYPLLAVAGLVFLLLFFIVSYIPDRKGEASHDG